MIENTFSIVNGIGERLERHIWRNGIFTWDDFINADFIPGISYEKKSYSDSILLKFSNALEKRDSRFFYSSVKKREHWRLFSTFKDKAVCLDIETNGREPGYGGYVTVIGFYDGVEYSCMVRGKNLNLENIQRIIDQYDCLITFYGSAFDIPFLLKEFPNLRFDIPHFDLCFSARRLGLKGGLKKLERYFGIKRDETVEGLSGYDAVLLWQMWRKGSREALELLLEYNREDTLNLMRLADIIYRLLRESTGIDQYLRVYA